MKASDIIKKARKTKKLTQQALAEKVGVSVQAVSQWEKGLTRPSVFTAVRLARELGLERDWLLNDDGMPEDLRNNAGKKIPKSRYVGTYQGLIPIIDLKDAAYFYRKINHSQSILPAYTGLVKATADVSGYHFAIEVKDDYCAPDIMINDLLIFSCDLFPDDGDYVCSQTTSLHYTDSLIGKFRFNGDDPFAFIYQSDGRSHDSLGVSGTLIEQRRFRKPREADVLSDDLVQAFSSLA